MNYVHNFRAHILHSLCGSSELTIGDGMEVHTSNHTGTIVRRETEPLWTLPLSELQSFNARKKNTYLFSSSFLVCLRLGGRCHFIV